MADFTSYMLLLQSGQTGQEKHQIFPESKTRFFYKETGVQNSPIETGGHGRNRTFSTKTR